jgi:trigger factor
VDARTPKGLDSSPLSPLGRAGPPHTGPFRGSDAFARPAHRRDPTVQVTVEKLGPCQAKIHFTVPSSEYHALYRRGLQNVGQNANMKGFRPGKVPPQILEKQFGTQVKNEAIEHFVRQAYDQAVKENDLKIVGFQRVNLDDVKILEGVDWQQSFEVSLRPEIHLGNEYKGVEIESELAAVMDAEVQDATKSVRMQLSSPEPAGDAGVPADGMIVGKIEWLSGDEVVLSRDGLRLSPAQPTPGVDAAAYEKALTGARDGEVREVEMTFPNEIEKAELRGQKGVTRVTVTQAYRMVPATDEQLRTALGAETDADVPARIREKLEQEKHNQENVRVENAILDQLLAKNSIDLPEMMLADQARGRLEQMKTQMRQQGVPDADIEKQAASQEPAAREAAAKGLRALFLMQAIAEKEKLLVSREDMEKELHSIAARNQAPVEEVRKYYQEKRLFDAMAIEMLERKVRAFLRENAKITTPS